MTTYYYSRRLGDATGKALQKICRAVIVLENRLGKV